VTDTCTIYVELLDEGVTVYRPVEALPDRDGSFRLPESAPEGELWPFAPGSRVVCELQDIGGAERSLVAIRSA
jgi:hypothetical protein